MQNNSKAAPERRPAPNIRTAPAGNLPSGKVFLEKVSAAGAGGLVVSPPNAAPTLAPALAKTPDAITAAKAATDASPKAAEVLPNAAPQTPAIPQPVPVSASKAPAAHPSEPAPATQPIVPAPATAWSNEDESAFQAMLARRKAAGYQRRGKDVGAQMLRPGEITPNAGTVVATIVGLVAAAGTVARGKLLDAMAKTTFPHAKARPADRGWAQGYISGALRDGFLAEASEGSPGEKFEAAAQ